MPALGRGAGASPARRDVLGPGARHCAPRAHRARRSARQRDRHAHARAGAGGRRRGRSPARVGRRPAQAARTADRPQGSAGHRRGAHDVRLAVLSRARPARRLPAGRALAHGGRDHGREDQHARVGRGLAHVQPGLRRDAQCVGREPLGRRLQRRWGGRPGLPHDPDRRRQRPRRLAAQPAGLERRARPAADARARAARAVGGALDPVRSGGPDGTHRRRSRAPARRDGRSACARPAVGACSACRRRLRRSRM